MFEIKDKPVGGCSIMDERHWYLHSNGSIWRTAEYFPTRERAQDVLDKFQPKHVWKHGDVFKNSIGVTMIYIEPLTGPAVYSVSCYCTGTCGVEHHLKNATFLFNIKEKL